MIKVKDGYGKLIGTTYQGSATQVLLSNGGNLEFSSGTKANTLVQRNANQHVYATYFNSAISDEALSDIGSVYVRNTSDTFIRRISKTQFYSIIDNKFVTLDTAQTITGVKTFSTGPILAINATITQNQNSTSNYTTFVKWLKGGTSQGTYNPSIGQHNTGGDGTGSICILPYPTNTSPWNGTVGLFISKGVLRLDGRAVAIAENYYDKETSDGRYAYRQGTNATGTWPINIQVKDIRSTNPTPNDKPDKAVGFWFNNQSKPGSSTWYSGITIKGWTDGYAVWQLASNATSTIADDNLYFRSGINSTWNAWRKILDTSNYSTVINGNYYTKTESDNRYVNVTGDTMTGPLVVKASITGTQLISNIANGTAPLKVTSKTVVTNLNSDLLDGYHETSFFRTRGSQTIASSIPTTTELSSNNNLSGNWNVTFPGASGHLVQFNTGGGSTRYMQFYSYYSGSLYWRNSTDSTLRTKSWKTIVDSANYTGIVLKIGTATKGSATLPIYLNAGTPTACSTTLGVSITGNAATATKLQTARTINGTSFNGTTNITTAYWGATRTITLSGAVTGSTSVNGSQNVTITTTYQTGSIDGRYVGGKKAAGHGSQGTAYTADTYSSNFVNKAFVAYAERGSWAYANNGYITTDTGVNIPLAGTAIFQWGASDTNKTQLFITPHNNSGVSNPATNEMLFYTSNGSGYISAWTRVLTHRNYTTYTVTKTGSGASGTWGISITGNANTATKLNSRGRLTALSGTNAGETGLSMYEAYSNGYPSAFGNLIHLGGSSAAGRGELLLGWAGSNGGYASVYYRNKRDVSTANWSSWVTLLDSSNYTSFTNANYVQSLGTNGNYVTWTKNNTVNNLTVPYAVHATYLDSNDTRNVNTTPNKFSSGARFEFKSNSIDGLSNGGSYHGILHFKPYGGTTDFSGGQTHQLGFTDSGNLWMRTSTSSTAWGSWKLILNQNTADGRYVTLTTNQTVSGIKTFSRQQKFTVATGTSPFTVSSTTVVSNLNADLLDGYHASKFYENGYTMFGYTINASSLNVNTYYPVTFSIGASSNVRIECRVALNSGTKPSWSTHASGFSVRKIWEVNGSGWGTNPINRRILVSDYAFTSTDPVRGIGQMSNGSIEYVYVRGGGKYHFYISHNVVPTLRTSTYTNNSQSVSPTTSAPAVISTPTLTFTAGRFSSLSYKPTTGINTVYIPTNTSHLTNDSGFLTGNVIRAVSANGYWGMARPDSNTSDWIRTTSSGIIPYQSGGRGAGHCGLGTSSWYFSSAYIDTVHGNLDGTATNADKLDGQHASAFSYKSWWHWSGQSGQPTWIWGGNSENNYYVYNPSNFSVNYATYSGSLSNNTSTNANTLYRNPGFTAWSVWSTFSNTPTNSYTNGINLNSSDTNYGWQLAKPAFVDRPYYRGRQAGSFTSWKGIAFTSDIPTVTNYYWANVKVSSSSSTSTSPTFSTAYTSNWFRSNGQTGWYSQTYGGGIYMTDSSYVRVYGGKRFYASGGYLAPYTGSSWISMATRTNCIVADQNNSASSAHALFRVKNSSGHAIAFGGLGANIGFYGFYASRISSGANGTDWSTVWNVGTGVITHSKTIYTAGYYHSSVNSNNYVLLAGGSYKNLADFAKGNAGSSTQGVYVTSGTVKAMTYSLKATVNSGSSGKLAYYSGTNSIDDYTSTKGSSSTPIYLNAGVPTACSGVIVKYWGWYSINCYSSTTPTYSKKGGNFNFVTSVSRRSEGKYTVGTVYPSGYTWNNTIYWGSGRLNKAMSSYSSNSLLYVTMFRGYQSGSTYYLYVNTADDSSSNDGVFDVFFLCF